MRAGEGDVTLGAGEGEISTSMEGKTLLQTNQKIRVREVSLEEESSIRTGFRKGV